MERDLNLTSNEYSIALLVFFVGYVIGEGNFVILIWKTSSRES
jgi:hypothetical protein